jgi:hypothetical protein
MTDSLTRVEPEKNRGGQWIRFGSEEYRVPALAFGAIQDLQDRVGSMAGLPVGGKPTPEQMATVVDVVHAALKRNYPSMTREQLLDMLDLENYQEVLGAVLNISGFKRQEPAQGEAVASTGTAPTSP